MQGKGREWEISVERKRNREIGREDEIKEKQNNKGEREISVQRNGRKKIKMGE